MRKWAVFSVSVACLLFLSSCTGATSQSTKAQMPPPPTSPPVVVPTIGPVPASCPVSTPKLHTISPHIATVVGQTPVWATWGPTSIYHEELMLPPGRPPTNYDPANGWEVRKIIWEVGPHYTQPISIHGHDLSDHAPVLIQLGDTPSPNAVLNPHHPDHPVSVVGDGWAEWGSYLIVPRAGCYTLEVSWSKGQWAMTFAFGA
ncbi:hypothetical protein EPA93_34750 [Ktedonosporobacter rubrisoli]|uniref:Uncharacterized protein n=1 Tax=Ktedonosporobacter rubrisoli TaxID=2509675 RepID=A0A4P6JZD1_KTERU|nr:hypothetical protein [Ktedonosporobacter rubrisoli]QBD80853.1 hypothetical protein EPA93_34750 [Ktedonosporobacter rubrisoli]